MFNREFSNTFKEFIENTVVSKNHLIKKCEIDRSTFYKYLRGDRLPTLDHYRKIINEMNLPNPQKQVLDKIYIKATMGDEFYRNFDNMMLSINRISYIYGYGSYTRKKMNLNYIDDGKEFYDNYIDVQYLLTNLAKEIVYNEPNKCDYYLPPKITNFTDKIYDLVKIKNINNTKFRSLMEINSKDNIEFMNKVYDELPLMLEFENYNLYYYYSKNGPIESVGILYPYYIILDEKAVVFSKDFSKAMVLNDVEAVQLFRDEFEKSIDMSEKLISNVEEVEYPEGAEDIFLINGSRYINRRFKRRKDKHRIINICSLCGIKNFITENMDGQKELVDLILNDINKGIYIYDDSKLELNDKFTIFVMKNRIYFYYADTDKVFVLIEKRCVKQMRDILDETISTGYNMVSKNYLADNFCSKLKNIII